MKIGMPAGASLRTLEPAAIVSAPLGSIRGSSSVMGSPIETCQLPRKRPPTYPLGACSPKVLFALRIDMPPWMALARSALIAHNSGLPTGERSTTRLSTSSATARTILLAFFLVFSDQAATSSANDLAISLPQCQLVDNRDAGGRDGRYARNLVGLTGKEDHVARNRGRVDG